MTKHLIKLFESHGWVSAFWSRAMLQQEVTVIAVCLLKASKGVQSN
jgi:hypothetical protein